jgi:ribose transport system ATP-binding protein
VRKEVFRADSVTYARSGVNILDNFNLHVFEGEAVGLFFADNHGKDEFVRLAVENSAIDYGRVFFMDRQVNSYSAGNVRGNVRGGAGRGAAYPRVGYVSGAGGLIGDMTVAENVFVMRRGFRKYIINRAVLAAQFAIVADEYGIDIDGGAYARDLSRADAYIIQTLKAVLAGSALVIIRNAGIEYGDAELTRFQQQVRRFAERGASFIYISGDIGVLAGVCDRIAIAEGGRVVRVVGRSEYTDKKLSKYHFYPDRLSLSPDVGNVSILRFDRVSEGSLSGMDFSVSEGESVLLWDRTDRIRGDMRRILGKGARPEHGEVRVNGVPLQRAAGARISYIRETPTRSMVFSEMSCLDNLCMRAAERVPSLWLGSAHREVIRREYSQYTGGDIDAPTPVGLPAESLYNLVYLREHIYNPQILVIERPFVETDVGLRLHIMSLIAMFKQRGTAVLIIDSSTKDSEAVAGRMLIVGGGCIAGEKKLGEGGLGGKESSRGSGGAKEEIL